MAAAGKRTRVVVVGLGMVGIAFIEKLLKLDARAREYDVVVIGDEPHLAYNRVGLTSFFGHREVESLYLNSKEWYDSHAPDSKLNYHLNTLVTGIDSTNKTVSCANGDVVSYDILVLATGSDAVLPTHTPGHDANGVFVYRTIDDLQKLIAFGELHRGTTGLVVGGGLLGLEAANAMIGLKCYEKVKLAERNRWVLSRQLDAEAGGLVVEKVTDMGIDILLSKRVGRIKTDEGNNVTGVVFEDGEEMDCSTICFAIGVQPRDSLARSAGIECAERGGGGILVKNDLSTSVPDVYAIGECASWENQTFGLIAPGVEMADVLSFNLTQAKLHQPRAFKRPDLSTKLKLLGVDVASFGDFFADRDGPSAPLPAKARRKAEGQAAAATNRLAPPSAAVKALTYKDPFAQVYKKYLFTADGKYLLGGMMVGDTRDYVKLVPMVKSQKELDVPPSQLILGAKKAGGGDDDDDDADDDLDDDTQICSCHNVTKGDVVKRVRDGTCKTVGEVQARTKAGTGCGGCVPLVTGIFKRAMRATGAEVSDHLCAHFGYSRADLYAIVMAKRLETLADVMREAGRDPLAEGCEACKPAVASILASLWNAHVMGPRAHGLQDTNDRYLGNVQRDGTFSVVPRVPAGEITPDRLIAVGEVARRYGLYTKITGGQRIDMFGARKQDLPDIWARLVAAGMESGHAYAKSLRTVKSCVGSSWCRFGVGDSVGMAVRVEERYKSIRSPHKIKGGVSGCVRECAEAQSKDFGLIATEKGFNIFVGGNGGAKPRHAQLLARDVAPSEVIPILDRYLMFYIRTADKLQRTAPWLEALPGGVRYLREVVLEDRLGVCAALEAQMQALVDSYFDEWAEAVRDPALARKFRQFANTDEGVAAVERETERGQPRPALWPRDSEEAEQEQKEQKDFAGLKHRWSSLSWEPLLEASYFAGADDVPGGVSAAVKRGDTQLAVWRVRGRYYVAQQMCPHKRTFALSDGLIGVPPSSSISPSPSSCSPSPSSQSSPYISCPFHKRNFDLSGGSCLTDPSLSIATFEAEERLAATEEDGHGGIGGISMVYARLPPAAELDAALGTERWKVRADPEREREKKQYGELDRRFGFGPGGAGRVRRAGRHVKGSGGGGDGATTTTTTTTTVMRRPVEEKKKVLPPGVGCAGGAAAVEW
ncbi:nitrite reductase [Biscogniauxia mediterranea]|nr:nitrite reductase [Biscogniauxia mediterranea]